MFGQRGRMGLFKLDDKSGVIEATIADDLVNANRNLIKDDEFVVLRGSLQPDRFSGGFRLKVAAVYDLALARCTFGKFLRVSVNGRAPDIARLARDFPPRREQTEQGELVRAMNVRLAVKSERAVAELQLGEPARFYPSDAALASWLAQTGNSVIVYE